MRYVLGAVVVLAIFAIGFCVQRAVRIFYAEYHAFFPARQTLSRPLDGVGPQLQNITFDTESGVRIAGWLLPSHNGAVVVYLHGSPGDRSGFLPLVNALDRHGYGAILIDMPGHGESGGRADWSVSSQQAAQGAIALALQQPGTRHVALFGYSIGSYIAAQVAAQDKRVDALILLAAFTNLADQIRYEFRSRIPLINQFSVIAARTAGVPVREMRTLDALNASSPRPILFIAGTEDWGIPVSMPQALFAAAHGPKELWLIEGADHVNTRDIAGPAIFDERVRTFLDNALAGNGLKSFK